MTARLLLIIAVMTLLSVQPLQAAEGQSRGIKMAKYQDLPTIPLKKPGISLDVKENFQYYDVAGMTPAELRKKMRENGTRWDDGKTYAAVTSWDIRYSYDTVNNNGLYGIKAVKTNVEIIFRLPRRQTASSSNDPMAEQWNSYMEKLMEHESGHRDLAVKAAADLSDALAALTGFDSRKSLEREADRLVQARLSLMKKAQVEYDVDTHHGETQGAILH